MPKEEWGLKRVCPSCTSRFYDLRRDPMTCPSCGVTFTVESLTAVRGKAPRPEKVKPEVVDVEELPDLDTDDEVIDSDDDLDADILEDEEDNVDLDDLADVAADEDET
jgi:uncharacterized protein (TIGR02300 family)